MDIPWYGDLCILCLKKTEMTLEHIIPESLGGCLTSRFLCWKCNSRLGDRVEHAARFDPSIRIAGQQLSADIPKLAKQIAENQRHFAESEAGLSPGYIQNGDFRVLSRKLPDGSLVQPTDEVRNTIERILQKSGYGQLPIHKALQKFDESIENKKIEIMPGLEIAKWRINKIRPDYEKNPVMNPLVPLKIAYEFISCHLGTTIYEDIPPLNEIRRALTSLDADSDSFRVERLHASEYKPFHGLCFEGNYPHVSVQIRLFGWLVFRVHFLKLAVGGPRYVYTQFLESGDEDLRELDNEERVI